MFPVNVIKFVVFLSKKELVGKYGGPLSRLMIRHIKMLNNLVLNDVLLYSILVVVLD